VDRGSRHISHQPPACNIVLDFDVDHGNMVMIYMSPNPYCDACEQPLDLQKFDLGKHATAELNLYQSGGRVHIVSMSCSTLAAKIPKWRTCTHGAWLIKIDDAVISTVVEAGQALKSLVESGGSTATLLFAYLEICPNLSHNGLPIVSLAPFSQHAHNQLNSRWGIHTVAVNLRSTTPGHQWVESGGVYNMVNWVMKLNQGKLLKQTDWNNWQDSAYLQLNHYYIQGMFSTPQQVDDDASVSFHKVWTYIIKTLNGRKKAQFACNSSVHLGQSQILDETYANCIDQIALVCSMGLLWPRNSDLWCGCLECFCQSTTSETRLLHIS
jgi:hypothetical protein